MKDADDAACNADDKSECTSTANANANVNDNANANANANANVHAPEKSSGGEKPKVMVLSVMRNAHEGIRGLLLTLTNATASASKHPNNKNAAKVASAWSSPVESSRKCLEVSGDNSSEHSYSPAQATVKFYTSNLRRS